MTVQEFVEREFAIRFNPTEEERSKFKEVFSSLVDFGLRPVLSWALESYHDRLRANKYVPSLKFVCKEIMTYIDEPGLSWMYIYKNVNSSAIDAMRRRGAGITRTDYAIVTRDVLADKYGFADFWVELIPHAYMHCRKLAVCALLPTGMGVADIAAALNVAESTVRKMRDYGAKRNDNASV